MSEQNHPVQQEEVSLSDLLKIRRDKLRELQSEGRDPFQQTRYEVKSYSQDIKDHFEELEEIGRASCRERV